MKLAGIIAFHYTQATILRGSVPVENKLRSLQKQAKQFPSLPGCYLMKRGEEEVLYVGKAKSLKSRVLSYFNKASGLKTDFLLKRTERIEYLLTENEVEAFLLEASLIKKHKPRYNVRLKDDKAYPYIRFSRASPFPRFYFERRVKNSKDLYFGPYTEGFNVRRVLEFINQSFLLRDCSDSDFKSRKRACLNFDMKICSAPCVQKISQQNYRKACLKAIQFLKGRSKSLVKELQTEMKQAVKELKFERAGDIRDRLQAIERMETDQVVVQKTEQDKDVIVVESLEAQHLIEILHFRQGRLIGNRFQKIKKKDSDFLLSFLNQYYSQNIIPEELIIDLGLKLSEEKLLQKVLSQKKSKPCLVVSKLDEESNLLVKRCKINAISHLKNEIQKSDKTQDQLKEIQKKFRLTKLPNRIECYDISHWQGSYPVGSGVVFEEGEPLKQDYRLYHLKSVPDGDDYLALQEVLSRRLKHTEWADPDLILIDGGKGQLKAVKTILESYGKADWAVVSLAKDRVKKLPSPVDKKGLDQKLRANKKTIAFDKKISKTKKTEANKQREAKKTTFPKTDGGFHVSSTGERFFLPGRKNPVVFPSHFKSLKMLLHLRDEAHRFAIKSHRKKRDKNFLKS